MLSREVEPDSDSDDDTEMMGGTPEVQVRVPGMHKSNRTNHGRTALAHTATHTAYRHTEMMGGTSEVQVRVSTTHRTVSYLTL